MSRTGSYHQTYSGVQFYPFDIRNEDINLVDIIMSLSKVCRYAGNTKEFYSVAEHSVLMAREFPQHAKLALLHDAAEAYFGDIPRPIKEMIPEIKCREEFLLSHIFEKYDLGPFDCRKEKIISDMDIHMLYLEKNSPNIMGGHDDIEWEALNMYGVKDSSHHTIEGWDWRHASIVFRNELQKEFDCVITL